MHACICGFSNGLGVRVADALSLLLLYSSSSSSSRGEDDDDDEEKRENGEKDVGCFVTKITLCDALVASSSSSSSSSRAEEMRDTCGGNDGDTIFVTKKDVAMSGGIFRASDVGDRKSIALCRRLRARVASSPLDAKNVEVSARSSHEIVGIAEDGFFFSSDYGKKEETSPIDVMFFCDGAGPLSVACNANERLRKRRAGRAEGHTDRNQEELQRPIFVYCTAEHHGNINNNSGSGGGDVGTIFVDDGSGFDVDDAEKSSAGENSTILHSNDASKSLYDALRPQFTVLFANAMDEAAKNVDEDEKRRRERRAALHWEYLKKTPEATPLLHAVNERSGDKNKDKFLSSSTSSTIVRQRDPSNSVSSSNSSSVFLPMALLVAHTATFAVTQIVKRRREAYLNTVMNSLSVSEEKEGNVEEKERGEVLAKMSLTGAEQWVHLDIFDCVKNVKKDFVLAEEEKTKDNGYETISTNGIDVAMENDPKDAILKHVGFDAVENIRKRCKIAIVGSGILTASLATCFASIGVSEIALIGDASDPRNINLPKAAQHPLLSACVGDPMFTLSECENDANAMALNERFPGTRSYFLNCVDDDDDSKDNNIFDIIVHVEGDAAFAEKSERETTTGTTTTTTKVSIPKIEASFAIRCGVVGDNQIGIVEVNRPNSKYAWTKCTDASLSLLVSSTVSLEIVRWAKGGRNKERLVYVDARGRGADALTL